MDLRGKRLLVLGGTYSAYDIKKYAIEHGIVLISAGNNLNHPLCKIADEVHYVHDVTDSEQLIKLIREFHIDGVFAGGNEDIIPAVIDATQETGLQFYATREQWDITGNKRAFKNACINAGVPAVPEYDISSDLKSNELSAIEYPVVIKPVDGSGSRGVYFCRNEEEIRKAYPQAVAFSRSKTIMCEKFMMGYIIVLYVTAIDGEYYVASMTDKYTSPTQSEMSTIAQCYLYPSRQLKSCIDKYFPAIKKLYRNIGIRDGVVGIQGFCENDEIVFTEVGYRLGGTAQQNYTKALYNYSNMELLINHALTGKMTNEPCREDPFFPQMCATIQLINRGGIVGQIEGYEKARQIPGVILIEKHYDVGDNIPVVDNVSMVHFRAFIHAPTSDELKEKIRELQNTIRVWNIEGKPMLQEYFDPKRIEADPNGKNQGMLQFEA